MLDSVVGVEGDEVEVEVEGLGVDLDISADIREAKSMVGGV